MHFLDCHFPLLYYFALKDISKKYKAAQLDVVGFFFAAQIK